MEKEYEDLEKMGKKLKQPEKKGILASALARAKENRQKMREEKKRLRRIYMKEYNVAREKAIKGRAKQEAREKYRPTRKQKIDEFLSGFSNLGTDAIGVSEPRRTSKKGSGKKQYIIRGGKAYPIAGSGGSSTKKRKSKKKQGGFDLDLDYLEDIEDFNF